MMSNSANEVSQIVVRDALPADFDLLTADVWTNLLSDSAVRIPTEASITSGNVQVVDVDGVVAGLVHCEWPGTRSAYLGTLAARSDYVVPDIGAHLIDYILRERCGEADSVSLDIEPRKEETMKMIFRRRFVARSLLGDTIGPGEATLYCQLAISERYNPTELVFVPTAMLSRVARLLNSDDLLITNLVDISGVSYFEISRQVRADLSALSSDEGMSSVAFSAGLLAAITFLLGFAFASATYPDEVRIVLIGATVVTTISLVVYANAAGELSRIRRNAFARYMRWGNLLSEYGGVIPLLIVLPVTFAQVARSISSLVAAGLVALGLALYCRSEFCVASRYRRTWYFLLLDIILCLSPILGVCAILYLPITWPWAVLVGIVVTARALLMLVQGDQEHGTSIPNEFPGDLNR